MPGQNRLTRRSEQPHRRELARLNNPTSSGTQRSGIGMPAISAHRAIVDNRVQRAALAVVRGLEDAKADLVAPGHPAQTVEIQGVVNDHTESRELRLEVGIEDFAGA